MATDGNKPYGGRLLFRHLASLIISLFDDQTAKIRSYCGPFGVRLLTALLAFRPELVSLGLILSKPHDSVNSVRNL